ncbi:TlpA disulfide reductase family protein [Solitalea lacus]|uniref:TlpA disulfide reductase family protein n=1 Tax=Solitalea lacus TaxID=2911172 RepID=UPI001EDC6E4A|nr:TlpA disulfide reductase family protein [Solitalea lacus]UKJ09180.1 redoxin domain-containing protein [Solitalea lacus]
MRQQLSKIFLIALLIIETFGLVQTAYAQTKSKGKISSQSKKEKSCRITGTVFNSNTQSILLEKINQDPRHDDVIEIPVENGKFHFETKLLHPEAVRLLLGKAKNEGGKYMFLFLENEDINLVIHSEEEFDKNRVQGGKLNEEYKKYKNGLDLKFNERLKPLYESQDEMIAKGQYSSDEMKAIDLKLQEASSQDEKKDLFKKMDDLIKQGLDKSPKAKIIEEKTLKIFAEQKEYLHKYIAQNPTIVSYGLFLNELDWKRDIDIDLAKRFNKILSKANPNHPYNELAINLISAMENIKIGKRYVDFSAPDLSGNLVKLSEKIEGKVALLDLWATWCGPCIANSKRMLPIYAEYKDKGFTIVGVAGEYKTLNTVVRFLEKEKWPWLNLVELDKKNKIWQKYGKDHSGGGIFLIDKEGKIIAIDPTAEEVKQTLAKLLG